MNNKNQPKSPDDINKEVIKEPVRNPNPAANENLEPAERSEKKNSAQQVNSEITDGEDA